MRARIERRDDFLLCAFENGESGPAAEIGDHVRGARAQRFLRGGAAAIDGEFHLQAGLFEQTQCLGSIEGGVDRVVRHGQADADQILRSTWSGARQQHSDAGRNDECDALHGVPPVFAG